MIIHSVENLPAALDKIVIWSDGRDGLQCIPFGGYETRQESVLSLLEARLNREQPEEAKDTAPRKRSAELSDGTGSRARTAA